MPAAVTITNSSDIRFRNVHVNGESGFATCDDNGCTTYLRASKFAYENSIRDVSNKIDIREREFAVFDYSGKQRAAPAALGKVDKLEGGFYSIAGAAVDAQGKLYFVDRHWKRIYSWSKDEGRSCSASTNTVASAAFNAPATFQPSDTPVSNGRMPCRLQKVSSWRMSEARSTLNTTRPPAR